MVTNIVELEAYIATVKKELLSHSLYKTLEDVDALNCFMSHHVYAVWDFMNLLSYLQSMFIIGNKICLLLWFKTN